MNPIDVRKDDSSADAELVDDEADDDPTGDRDQTRGDDGTNDGHKRSAPASQRAPFCAIDAWSGLRDGSVVVGLPGVALLADHVEAAVELDVDLAAVGARDLDLVVALLVADLGLGDRAVDLVQRCGARLIEGAGGNRGLRVACTVVPAATGEREAGPTRRDC